MLTPEELPDENGPWHLGVARLILKTSLNRIEPEGEIGMWWDDYEMGLTEVVLGGVMPFDNLHTHRMALEAVCGGTGAELLVAAMKMSLSALCLAAMNPASKILGERDQVHNDLAPLIAKGAILVRMAYELEPFDGRIQMDEVTPGRLKASYEKAFMAHAINCARRPDAL